MPGEFRISLTKENNNIIFTAENPTQKESIKNKEKRSEYAKKVNPLGSGLGLKITKKIIEDAGGEFITKHRNNKFTTHISFPCSD